MSTVNFRSVCVVLFGIGPIFTFNDAAFAASGKISVAMNAPRQDTLLMSCAQAHSVVERSGSVVLNSGQYKYDLYHSDGESCYRLMETQQPAFVPARDTASCFIGYTCQPPDALSTSRRR